MSSAPSPRLHSLPLLGSGKVRDNYAVGEDRLLMVTSDRLSAFDVIMAEPIPDKGRVLNTLALFWFDKLKHVVPNHLTGEAPESVVQPDEIPLVQGRSMLVKRLKPILVEAVVRGYLVGSGYKEYLAEGSVSGIALPPGIAQAERLDAPIFTPAAKAELGQHDENISFDEMVARIGADLAEQIRATSLTLYREASEYAATRGIISPPSFDKQFVRDYLDTIKTWNRQAPPPPLPLAVIEATSNRYREAYERLTGQSL